jgi:hypothetical protein
MCGTLARVRGAWKPSGGKSRGGLLFALLVVACRRHEPDAIAAEPAPSSPPLDRLAPGELIPGDKKAFTIVLPRDVKVDQALTDVVFASGPVSASDLANYVSFRVRDGTKSIGATATVFDQVKAVEDPSRTLFVRIFPGPSGRGSRIEVRDITAPPPPAPSNTAEQWKKFGLSPDGKLLDPQHLR